MTSEALARAERLGAAELAGLTPQAARGAAQRWLRRLGLEGRGRAEAARGAAVLFSSHQLDLVEDLCDDVVTIDHGRVVLSGAVEDLRSRSPRRQLDLVVDGDASWLQDVPGAEVIRARDGHVQVTLSDDVDLVALLDRAPAGGSVRRLSYAPPSLSDLFRGAVSA